MKRFIITTAFCTFLILTVSAMSFPLEISIYEKRDVVENLHFAKKGT